MNALRIASITTITALVFFTLFAMAGGGALSFIGAIVGGFFGLMIAD